MHRLLSGMLPRGGVSIRLPNVVIRGGCWAALLSFTAVERFEYDVPGTSAGVASLLGADIPASPQNDAPRLTHRGPLRELSHGLRALQVPASVRHPARARR